MEMIVLRTRRYDSLTYIAKGSRSSFDDSPSTPSKPTLEIEDLAPRELKQIEADPDAVAAPPMPLMLIKPMGEASEGAPPDENWGLEAVGATTSSCTGAGVKVAVLDTGIDKAHKAFRGVSITPKNFTQGAEDDVFDSDGHGTHCAGVIFGRDVNGRRIGVARGVTDVLVGKVFGPGGSTTEAIFKALLWAIGEDSDIISLSMGLDFMEYRRQLALQYPDQLATSFALAGYRANLRLFDRLSQLVNGGDPRARKTIVVTAAGNESQRQIKPEYRIEVSPPAAAEQFLSVAALGYESPGGSTADTPRYSIAPFSNMGARFCAPGVDIWSAQKGSSDGLIRMSGTSMAAPHVAGVAALWVQKLGGTQRVVEKLAKSADEIPYLDALDIGAGLVQAPR